MASRTKDTKPAKTRPAVRMGLDALGSRPAAPASSVPASRDEPDAAPALPHRATAPTVIPTTTSGLPRSAAAGTPSSTGIPRTGATPVGGTSANLQDALIPLDNIAPDPNQPRKLNADDVDGLAAFERGLDELAGSIERNGLIESIEVRPAPPGTLGLQGQPVEFILVVGERRYRAHLRLNATSLGGRYAKIRAKVETTLTADKAFLRQVAENSDRESLTPIQRARELNTLRGVLARQDGYTNKEGRAEYDWQDMITHKAMRLRGEGQNAINTYSRLASLPEDVQLMLINHSVPEASKIVKAIVRLKVGEHDEQIKAALSALLHKTAASASTGDEAAKLRTQAARDAKAAKVKGEVVYERDTPKMGIRPAYSLKVIGLFPKETDPKVKGRAVASRPSAELAILKHILDELTAEVGHRERTPMSVAVPKR